MTAAMDRAMASMQLEEDDDDLPCQMPNIPEFSSAEINKQSLIGRALNPEGVKMSSLILDMPRKWQKVGKVRGVALSNERFQFIFDQEHDLQEILDKGVHTYNEWTLVLERWVESPPPDYLQFIPVWMRMRGIPVNHRTVPAITWLAEKVGRVTEVAYDEKRAQSEDYTRVRISFDVSKPLRRSKVFNLPSREPFTIRFNFEKIQKRCYECQRLTHEKERCPQRLRKEQEVQVERRARGEVQKLLTPLQPIKETDPLFGVLRDDQIGIDPTTGRPRIAEDVLQGIRRYLIVDNGDAQPVKIGRVQQTVVDAEKDPISQKVLLRLETPPIVSQDLNKGKGCTFDYDSSASSTRNEEILDGHSKLMKDALKTGSAMRWKPDPMHTVSEQVGSYPQCHPFSIGSTEKRLAFQEAGPSGIKRKGGKPRRRPYKSRRKLKNRDISLVVSEADLKMGAQEGSSSKRQASDEILDGSQGARRQKPEIVPKEGLSRI